MKKRLIALLLAFVMVLGLTATVFAEGGISIASIQPEAPTHTYIFQAGGVEIGRQIIKHNESLKDPGVPSAPAGQRFVRWDPGGLLRYAGLRDTDPNDHGTGDF